MDPESLLVGVAVAAHRSSRHVQQNRVSLQSCLAAASVFTSPCVEKQKSKAASSSRQDEAPKGKEAVSEAKRDHESPSSEEGACAVMLDDHRTKLSKYERERLERMAVNKQLMLDLKIETPTQKPKKLPAKPRKSPKTASQHFRKSPRYQQKIEDRRDPPVNRTIEKTSNQRLSVKKKCKSAIGHIRSDKGGKRKKPQASASSASRDDWDEGRSCGITIRGNRANSVWEAYVNWYPSLRKELPEPKRTQFPVQQRLAHAGAKFNCFEEAYQGRKAYLEEHLGVAKTQQVLRREELRKDHAQKDPEVAEDAVLKLRSGHAKRKESFGSQTNKVKKRPKSDQSHPETRSSSALNGASLTSLIRSVSRSRHSTTSPKSTTSCISGKRKILPQSRSVLPWGVFFDRRWRSNHPFQASLSWPMAMWKVVKGLGYQFRPAKRGGEWKHSLGSFKTAQVARDALETFIDNLPYKDLKMKLFRHREETEKRKGYCHGDVPLPVVPSSRADEPEGGEGSGSRSASVTSPPKQGASEAMPLAETRQTGGSKVSHAKTSKSSCAARVLPWGVYRYRHGHRYRCRARIFWPRPMWDAVKKLGHEFLPNAEGSIWVHRVGLMFESAREARDAIETFIGKLPRKLKTTLFARRAMHEKLSGYDKSGDTHQEAAEDAEADVEAAAAEEEEEKEPEEEEPEEEEEQGKEEQEEEEEAARGRKKAKTEEAGRGTPETAEKLRVGDHVTGRFPNGRWYGAVIKHKIGDRFVVDWDDGDDRDREKGESELRALEGPDSESAEVTIDSETRREERKRDEGQKAEFASEAECIADGEESEKESHPGVDEPIPLPWGIIRRKKKHIRFEASFRLPVEFIGRRTCVESGGRSVVVRPGRRPKLGCFDTMEEAISAQTEFIDGLEDQELAQDLRRRRDGADRGTVLEASGSDKGVVDAQVEPCEQVRPSWSPVGSQSSSHDLEGDEKVGKKLHWRKEEEARLGESVRQHSASVRQLATDAATTFPNRTRGAVVHRLHRLKLVPATAVPTPTVDSESASDSGGVVGSAIESSDSQQSQPICDSASDKAGSDLELGRDGDCTTGQWVPHRQPRWNKQEDDRLQQAVQRHDGSLAGVVAEFRDRSHWGVRKRMQRLGLNTPGRKQRTQRPESVPANSAVVLGVRWRQFQHAAALDRDPAVQSAEDSAWAPQLESEDIHAMQHPSPPAGCSVSRQSGTAAGAVQPTPEPEHLAVPLTRPRTVGELAMDWQPTSEQLERLEHLDPVRASDSLSHSGQRSRVIGASDQKDSVCFTTDGMPHAEWKTEGSDYLHRSVRFWRQGQPIDGIVVGWRARETGRRAAMWRLWIHTYADEKLEVTSFVDVQEEELKEGMCGGPEPTKRTRVEAGQRVWEAGTEVEARHEQQGWRAAKIQQVRDSGEITVEWADGDASDRAKAGWDIRLPRPDTGARRAGDASLSAAGEDAQTAAAEEREKRVSCCAVCLSDSKGTGRGGMVECGGCGVCVHERCYGVEATGAREPASLSAWCCSACASTPTSGPSRAGSRSTGSGAADSAAAKAERPEDMLLLPTRAPAQAACVLQGPTDDREAARCVLCAVGGGALKGTAEGEWVHVLCGRLAGLALPAPRLEPATGLRALPSQPAAGSPSQRPAPGPRTCARAHCRSRARFSLPCAHPACARRVHPPCAILDRLPMWDGDGLAWMWREEKGGELVLDVSAARVDAADSHPPRPSVLCRAHADAQLEASGPARLTVREQAFESAEMLARALLGKRFEDHVSI